MARHDDDVQEEESVDEEAAYQEIPGATQTGLDSDGNEVENPVLADSTGTPLEGQSSYNN